MSFSVIIPSRNNGNLVACVESIRAAGETCRVIVIDDGLAKYGLVATAFMPLEIFPGVKPFIFARAINQGIRAAGRDDVILLNDDTRLLTPGGFTALAGAAQGHGIISAALTGASCNPNQFPQGAATLRLEPQMLAFVCVCIPRATVDRVGLLDERFTAYGFEDNDYCDRVLEADLDLAIFDGCRVEHGVLPSTFRPGNGPGNISAGRAIYNRIRAERLARA